MSVSNGSAGKCDYAVPRPPQSMAGNAEPMKDWDSVPLFMRSLPNENTAPEADNNTLAALQSLMFDDPPSGQFPSTLHISPFLLFFLTRIAFGTEVAATLKAKANELFSERKFRDAVGFYTQAIEECGKDLEMEELRILWSNRAAANLELGQFTLNPLLLDLTDMRYRELRRDSKRRRSRSRRSDTLSRSPFYRMAQNNPQITPPFSSRPLSLGEITRSIRHFGQITITRERTGTG